MGSITLEQWYEVAKVFATAVGALGGISATIISWLNRKKTDRVYLALNGRLEQLLRAEHARGRLAEREDVINGVVPNPAQMALGLPELSQTKESIDEQKD